MSKKLDRLNEMIAVIKEKNGATVKELATIFDVSEMTIRRDLSVLESNQVVNIVYGAAIYNPGNIALNLDKSYSLRSATNSHHSEKARIGAYAASLLHDDDIIIIDSGSTTEQLAKAISYDIKATVLCYNSNILSSLINHENIQLIFAGGYYHSNTQMFESTEGITLIKNNRATKAFLSAAGVHDKLGITCATNYESPTKKAVISSAMEHILLADSSKFGEVRSSYFAELTEFNKIITDSKLPLQWQVYIKNLGIELIMV